MNNMFYFSDKLQTLTFGKNTLKKNIFTSLPDYKSKWYYTVPNASEPLALNTVRKDGKLFTAYNFRKMAGTWSTMPAVRSITIQNPKGADITGKIIKVAKKTYQLKALALPDDASQEFTWKSSNTNIAVVKQGKVTFKKAGTVKITATAKDGSGTSAWVKLKTDIKATKINIIDKAGKVINQKTVKINTKTYTLKGVAIPAKFAKQTLTWKSSNTNIAVVKQGKVTFLKAGTVKITATARDGSKVSNWVKLTYKPASGKSAKPAVMFP